MKYIMELKSHLQTFEQEFEQELTASSIAFLCDYPLLSLDVRIYN